MSLRIPKAGGPDLFRDGYSFSTGIEEAVLRNIEACTQLADTVRTSFGPNGRNKMVINHLDKLFVTNDAATIVRELEVVHPAARILVMASQQQESEVGDRTNFVIMLAGELLRKAEVLIQLGLHPSEVVAGYELARDRADQELASAYTAHRQRGLGLKSNGGPTELVAHTITLPFTPESLVPALRPIIASKHYGNEDFLGRLVAEASLMVMPANHSLFNVDNVRVVKILGGGLSDSRVVKGMVFNRQPEGAIKKAFKAKVGVFTCGIDVAQTETKGTVLLRTAEELKGFSKDEERHMERIFRELADSGIKVIVAGSSVADLALHFLDRLSIVVVKVLSKFDLRRLCRVVGATPLARLGAPTPDEMGYVDVLECVEVGGDRVTVFRQDEGPNTEQTRTATIVVRGGTMNVMDDVERAIDDGVSAIKALVRDGRLVAGAGATEVELAKRVAEYGERTPGLAQHAICRFADALEVVPRTLAENAGLDGTEVLSRLYAAHQASDDGVVGVDIDNENGGTLDARKAEILDLLVSTQWALHYGCEAALSVLRVDAIIMSKAAGIAAPKQNPNWDDD